MPPKGYRIVGGGSGGGGGGGTTPNILWTDPVKYRDAISGSQLLLRDNIKDRDAILSAGSSLKFTTDNFRLLDSRQVPSISALYPEPVKYKDRGIGRITELICARSGTPDTDVTGDGWTDGIPLNNGVNHGNESPLPTSGNLLSATSQFPYFKWNLTTPKFIGLAHRAGIGTCQFSFFASQGLAIVQTLNVILWPLATNPFTESTLTFTNQPAVPGTGTITRSFSVLVGAANGRYDINLTAAEFAPFIGNYMVIRMDSSAVAATPINIVSREGAAAERPRLTFDFQIGA